MAETQRVTDVVPRELQGKGLTSPMDFEQLYKFAHVFHASGMFEDITDAAQAFVKIVRGAELGIPPAAAMTGFDIIKKRLFVKPWLIAAKINSCGYGSYEVQEQTAEQCTIAFLRKYPTRGWVTLPPVTYTITEARGHGLVQRSPHWQTSPANMLYMRCMGRGGAMYFPELLAGIEPPPEPEQVPADSNALRSNIVALYGEPLAPTAPSARVPVPEPAPSAPAPKEATATPEPAGEAGFEYIARIEAAILANHGQIEPWYTWAERRVRKPRTAFSVQDWQAFLEAVEAAGRRNAPKTAEQAPGDVRAPGHDVETTPPDLFAQEEAKAQEEARAEEYGA